MPYHVGAKGSNGCSGYPVVSDEGHVAGCHGTESEATAQLGALYANVPDATKAERAIESSGNPENPSESVNPKAGMKKPEVMPKGKKKRYRANKAIDTSTLLKDMVAEGDFVIVASEDETYVGIVQYVMTEGMFGIATSDYAIEASAENPVVLVRTLELEEDEGIWEESEYLVGAEAKMVTKIEPLALEVEVVSNGYKDCGCPTCEALNVDCENCPVCSPMPGTDSEVQMAMYDSQVGKSECCPDINKQAPCWDGYVQRGMKPGKNGKMVPNCVPAEKADDLWEDDDTVVYETDSMSKADGYSPPAGARSAARRAIKFKEDGKANGAGTAVGWTRAGQLARGESLSLSTVKRMYSYFSRHEVDKKGKDWGNTANPSNGYIMWLAWGGDAGFSWSRGIVNREKDKGLFANFGKDYSTVQPLSTIFKEGDK
jgi:hypothetical protein